MPTPDPNNSGIDPGRMDAYRRQTEEAASATGDLVEKLNQQIESTRQLNQVIGSSRTLWGTYRQDIIQATTAWKDHTKAIDATTTSLKALFRTLDNKGIEKTEDQVNELKTSFKNMAGEAKKAFDILGQGVKVELDVDTGGVKKLKDEIDRIPKKTKVEFDIDANLASLENWVHRVNLFIQATASAAKENLNFKTGIIGTADALARYGKSTLIVQDQLKLMRDNLRMTRKEFDDFQHVLIEAKEIGIDTKQVESLAQVLQRRFGQQRGTALTQQAIQLEASSPGALAAAKGGSRGDVERILAGRSGQERAALQQIRAAFQLGGTAEGEKSREIAKGEMNLDKTNALLTDIKAGIFTIFGGNIIALSGGVAALLGPAIWTTKQLGIANITLRAILGNRAMGGSGSGLSEAVPLVYPSKGTTRAGRGGRIARGAGAIALGAGAAYLSSGMIGSVSDDAFGEGTTGSAIASTGAELGVGYATERGAQHLMKSGAWRGAYQGAGSLGKGAVGAVGVGSIAAVAGIAGTIVDIAGTIVENKYRNKSESAKISGDFRGYYDNKHAANIAGGVASGGSILATTAAGVAIGQIFGPKGMIIGGLVGAAAGLALNIGRLKRAQDSIFRTSDDRRHEENVIKISTSATLKETEARIRSADALISSIPTVEGFEKALSGVVARAARGEAQFAGRAAAEELPQAINAGGMPGRVGSLLNQQIYGIQAELGVLQSQGDVTLKRRADVLEEEKRITQNINDVQQEIYKAEIEALRHRGTQLSYESGKKGFGLTLPNSDLRDMFGGFVGLGGSDYRKAGEKAEAAKHRAGQGRREKRSLGIEDN